MYYLFAVFLVAGLDQLTKYIVVKNLNLYDSIEIIPRLFNLTHVVNRGAAFSLFAEIDSPWRHYFFLVIGFGAVVALTVLWFRVREEEPLQGGGIVLIVGGACGNLIDRIRFGEVVDFLDFYLGSKHWPAFNVADIAICSGVAVVLVFTIFENKKGTTTEVNI